MSESERDNVATRFQAGNVRSLKHGTTAARRIAPVARTHRRKLMRQLGLRAADLDPIGKGYLDIYCRVMSKVEMADRYILEHGLLRADGEPQPVLKAYTSWANAARLSLTRLESHLGARNQSASVVLSGYLDEHYGETDDAAA